MHIKFSILLNIHFRIEIRIAPISTSPAFVKSCKKKEKKLIVLLQKHFRILNYCLIYTVLSFSRYTMRNCIIARTLFHKKIRVTWYMILKVVIICLSKLLLFFKLTRWQRQKFRFRDRSQCCCCWGSRRLRRRRFWSYWGTVQRVAVAWRNGM